MSILIKGMKMPQNCYDCRFERLEFCNRSTQSVCDITGVKVENCDRPSWCPLVEIHPHGRLTVEDGEIVENS